MKNAHASSPIFAPSDDERGAYLRLAEERLNMFPQLRGSGGCIIIYEGKACGWSLKLTPEAGWLAGCIAVPVNGDPLLQAGGHLGEEADHWQIETPESRCVMRPMSQRLGASWKVHQPAPCDATTRTLALPAPSEPLSRYLAIREAHLANPYLATTEHMGVLKVFSGTVSEDIIRYRNARIESNLKHNRRARSRVRRMAKRHQAKWPPLAGTGSRSRTFSELTTWFLDGSLPDAESTVMVATYEGDVGEGFYDGEHWCWSNAAIIPTRGVAAWAELPDGPVNGRRAA